MCHVINYMIMCPKQLIHNNYATMSHLSILWLVPVMKRVIDFQIFSMENCQTMTPFCVHRNMETTICYELYNPIYGPYKTYSLVYYQTHFVIYIISFLFGFLPFLQAFKDLKVHDHFCCPFLLMFYIYVILPFMTLKFSNMGAIQI